MPDVPTAAAAAATAAAAMPASSLNVLATLLLCGLMGVLGQGIRAAVGLKSLSALPQQGAPNQQSTFSAAYFCLSLMIGFIAGVLAGIAIGLNSLLTIDVNNLKTLLGCRRLCRSRLYREYAFHCHSGHLGAAKRHGLQHRGTRRKNRDTHGEYASTDQFRIGA
jgi:hypothetical protein